MNILMLFGSIPFPINNGKNMRSFKFIEMLSKKHDLFLLSFRTEIDEEALQEAKKYFKEIWLVDRVSPYIKKSNFRIKLETLLDIFNFVPWEIRGYANNSFQEKFIEIIQSHKFDVIFVRYVYLSQYIINNNKRISCRTVIDLDDIEFIKNYREFNLKQFENAYEKYRELLNILIYKKYYKKINIFNRSFVCSEKDKLLMENYKLLNNASVIPNTINIEKYASVRPLSSEILSKKVMLFCGALNYEPNISALKWFVYEILPLVLREEPYARLHIVGLDPTKEVIECVDGKNIFLFPNVPSLLPYYESSSMSVVPIRVAGGTRIKILESFACRRSVVSTTVGAEGLGVEDNEHCLLRDSPKEFALACIDLLRDIKKTELLTKNGFSFVHKNFDILSIQKRIVNEVVGSS